MVVGRLEIESEEYKLWQKFKTDSPTLYNNTVKGNIKFNDQGILDSI